MVLDKFERFQRKIVTADELKEIIGPRPRDQKVIMCHGTFDIVHPGHIRHMVYASQKADILVASLTADKHIKKADVRPYVPEDLRAINLAALEVVDYVLVDPNAKPLENLAKVQPDYFAKGYEYTDGHVDPRTQEEVDVLEAYGGEIIFTPGDIVYSSSYIIENTRPDIGVEKIMSLLSAENMTLDDIEQGLDRFKGCRVHVIGDTIVDSLTRTTLIGGGTKTPTLSVRHESREDYVGGAGIVAKHLKAAGADVHFTTVLGQDKMAEFVLDDLREAGVACDPLIDQTRPTTNKNTIISGGYRLLKVDTLDNRAISGKVLDAIINEIKTVPADLVIFSDFRHGIFNRDTVPLLTAAIPDDVVRVADSQVASRWGDITEFQGFDLLTPNEREARFALADQDSIVRPLATELKRKANCRLLILKLGSRGILVHRDLPYEHARAAVSIESFAENAIDPVGAGDALLAYSSLALASTGNDIISSVLGCIAAGLECEYDGNIPITPDAVRARLKRIQRVIDYKPDEVNASSDVG
jgi:rfaE bifunctional protein kinase chain/domain